MTLTNSGSAATATPAPAPSAPATVNPSAVTSGDSHRALPPAPSTQLDGDISFDMDSDAPITAPAPETPAPAPETPETPKAPEETDPFDVVPPSVKDALAKSKKPEAKPEVEKAIETPVQEPAGRTYTGITEVDAVLKKLPNATYNAVKDQIPQWYNAFKKQSEAPKYLAAHPEAYTLMPEYREAQEQVQNTSFEAESLRDALIACKSGQPVKLVTGYNSKTGEPIYETFQPREGKHDPKLEIAIQSYYNTSINQLNAARQQLQGTKQSFEARVKEEHAFVEQSFAKVFPNMNEKDFTPEEQAFKASIDKIIPDSITPAHARKLAHYSMVAQRRLAMQFADYVAQTSAPKARPAKGAAAVAGDVADIPLSEDDMFGGR